jgi:hypothetical protein
LEEESCSYTQKHTASREFKNRYKKGTRNINEEYEKWAHSKMRKSLEGKQGKKDEDGILLGYSAM